MVAYNRLNTMEKHQPRINRQAQKVVAVADWRWAFTISSNCKDLTGKILVFWMAGRLWEVVIYEKWSQMEVAHYATCFKVWNFKLETLYSFVSYLTKAYKHCL